MTDAELLAAYEAKREALQITGSFHVAIRELSPKDRARVDAAQARRERMDDAIVDELRRRGEPVVVGGLMFHLVVNTCAGKSAVDGYAVIDDRTRRFVPRRLQKDEATLRKMLFDYSRPIPPVPRRAGVAG